MTRSISTSLFLVLATLGSGCLSHTRDGADAGLQGTDTGPVLGDCACGFPDANFPDAFRTLCDAQLAFGVGACEAELGYVWRGGWCEAISGCSCEGEDCGALAPTREACLEAHASCDRYCGGFGGRDGCLASEYCDYPDGSSCGGDDSSGLCAARPTDCPEPGGVTVCGCDGLEYIGECSAYLAGTDISRIGPCVTSGAYRTASATPSCGPADGPAWELRVTTRRYACDETPTDGWIGFTIWRDLNAEPGEQTYRIAADLAGDGQGAVCGRPGDPCAQATGTVTMHFFATGEVARFDYDLRTDDGRRFAESDLELTSFCAATFPGCG
jgi:hypothetical protein